jgi:hypothetical protein
MKYIYILLITNIKMMENVRLYPIFANYSNPVLMELSGRNLLANILYLLI